MRRDRDTKSSKPSKAKRPGWAKTAVPSQARLALRTRQVVGHVTLTNSTGTAWYRLDPVPWSFRPDRDREQHIINQAAVLAGLSGQSVRIRGTQVPFPVRDWAQAHHRLVIGRQAAFGAVPLPCWPDLLAGEQRQFLGEHLAEKQVYLGVDYLHRTPLAQLAAGLLPRSWRPLARELNAQQGQLAALDTLIGRPGMRGRPVTAGQMAWLLHRSTHLGFPAPKLRSELDLSEWDAGDLAGLLDQVSWTAEPFATTLKVTGMVDGRNITRHVAVLTVGRMQPMTIPQADLPWMAVPDQLGIPLEWSAHLYVRHDHEVREQLRRVMSRITSQTKHYQLEHDQDPPTALREQHDLALQVEAELSDTQDLSASRARGWWRLAVSGATETECLENVERVVTAYARRVQIEHTYGQHDLAREFLPGEPVRIRAHRRDLPVRTVAAGGAAITSTAGDRRGWAIGRAVLDGRTPVMYDLWANMERFDVAGYYAILAGLGGGKSTLVGVIIGKTGAAGIPWASVDPAGRLGRLARTAPLRSHARALDLVNGHPGSLNTYRLVADPHPDDFTIHDLADLEDADLHALGVTSDDVGTVTLDDLNPDLIEGLRDRWLGRARVRAQAARRRLTVDSLSQVLPASLVVRGDQAAHVTTELLLAATLVDAADGPFAGRPKHPGLIIDALRQSKTEHRQVALTTAELLDSIRHEPLPSLLFPERDEHEVVPFDRQLMFFSTKGIALPDQHVGQEYWGDEARQGVAILNLASWLCLRWVYGLPAGQRKGVALDEVHFLEQLSSGRLMLTEFARNSRKQNLAVLAAKQEEAAGSDNDTLRNLIGGAFLGRMDDEQAAARALGLVQIPTGVGYEQALLDLPRPTDDAEDVARQFLFYSRGGAGFKELIEIARDGDHLDWLWTALESAPGQTFHRAAV